MPRLTCPTIAQNVLPELEAKLRDQQSRAAVPAGAQSAPSLGALGPYLSQVLHMAVPLVLAQLESQYGDQLRAIVAKARSGVHLVLADTDIEFLQSLLDQLKTGE